MFFITKNSYNLNKGQTSIYILSIDYFKYITVCHKYSVLRMCHRKVKLSGGGFTHTTWTARGWTFHFIWRKCFTCLFRSVCSGGVWLV